MNERPTGEEKSREELRREARERRFQKKRAWNNRRFDALGILLLGLVFIGILVFLTVFPRSTVSALERRTLAEFPKFTLASYFSGDFTADVAEWYDDTVPRRDELKNTANTFKRAFGFETEDTIVFINQDVVAQDLNAAAEKKAAEAEKEASEAVDSEPTPAPTPTPTPTPTPQKDYTGEEAEFDVSNSLMLVLQEGHWRGLSMFGGGSGNTYVEALNTLHERLGDGVTIYSVPAPLSSQFYTPRNGADYTVDQEACFDSIAERLDEGIVSVNVCPVMREHTEEPIYLRTDHHWGQLGAYYAAKTFAEAAGVPFADISTYEQHVNEGYVGTLYSMSGDTRLLYDPEDFYYYVPTGNYETYYYDQAFNYEYSYSLIVETDVANSYIMFISGDGNVVKVVTEQKNGRKLLVVKDSYGNAEIPFFTGSFEEVYVTDVRYFEGNLVNFIQDRGITDVLITMCSYSVVGANGDNIMTLINQNPDEHLIDGQLPTATEPPMETQEDAEG